ncbi:MAG: primase [Nevskia sp.]|nr:primase [Nevskia sp.]
MSRIPESFIQDLLTRTDIVDVIGARLDLKRAGKEYKARSPFTNEKSPSFFVSPTKQMYFCFSSGKTGNAIGFLMEYDRLTFVEAVEELAKRAGVEVPREGGDSASRLVLDGPLDALAAAERIFRSHLRTHPAAIEYLKKRGVSGDTAKLFGIGFAPEAWDTLAQQFPNPEHALAAGLLKKKDDEGGRSAGRIYDVFRNRIMFPIRDTRGRVIAFGGRTLGDDPAKYLNSQNSPEPEASSDNSVLFHKGRNLFGLYEAKQSTKAALPYLLVVEGYMDVVMLAQHGIHNAVATLGTATTREHLALLFKSTARAVFCFDGDRAGRSAASRALEQALPEVNEGRECRFMFLPDGHDPDTLVQAIGADAFRELVDGAMTLSDFLIAELSKDVNLGSLDGRARLVGLARPYLQKLREGPLRILIIEELARITRFSRADFEATLASGAAQIPRAQSEAVARPQRERPDQPGARPVKRALQLLLEKPDMAQRVQHIDQLALVAQPGVPILVEAIEFFQEHPNSSSSLLFEQWRGAPKGDALQRISISDLERPDYSKTLTGLINSVDAEKEFFDCLAELRMKALRARAEALAAQARVGAMSPAEMVEWEEITRQLSARSLVE